MEQLTCEFKTLADLETKQNEFGQDIAEIWGLASTYQLDRVNDVVEPGAFKSATAEGTSFLFAHDQKEPIGRILELKEVEGKGLEFKAELLLDVQRAREVAALIKAKALNSTSIGYKVRPNGATFSKQVDPASGRSRRVRHLKDLFLGEISVVGMPANPGAEIFGIKAWDAGEIPDPGEFEAWLREAAGFSRSQARCVIAKGFKQLWAEQEGHVDDDAEREAGSVEHDEEIAGVSQKTDELDDEAVKHAAALAVQKLLGDASVDLKNLIGDIK